jgi:hypothetical protein
MSSAADLLLAAPSETGAIIASDYPLGTFKGVNVDGLDPLKLAALQALLAARPFAEALGEYQPMAQASPTGPWLVKLPSELVERLIHISPQDQQALAERWVATDQAQEEGWSVEVADNFLGRLIPFAHTASFETKELYLWIYS